MLARPIAGSGGRRVSGLSVNRSLRAEVLTGGCVSTEVREGVKALACRWASEGYSRSPELPPVCESDTRHHLTDRSLSIELALSPAKGPSVTGLTRRRMGRSIAADGRSRLRGFAADEVSAGPNAEPANMEFGSSGRS